MKSPNEATTECSRCGVPITEPEELIVIGDYVGRDKNDSPLFVMWEETDLCSRCAAGFGQRNLERLAKHSGKIRSYE